AWVAERGIVEIPSGVSFEEGSFVEPVNTCLKAIEKARVSPDETAIVIGQGPIGLLLLMLARLAGATVYASDPMPERRAAATRFGAAEAFDPRGCNLLEEIRTRTESRGGDVALVAVPFPTALTEPLSIVRPAGSLL